MTLQVTVTNCHTMWLSVTDKSQSHDHMSQESIVEASKKKQYYCNMFDIYWF